MLTGVWVLALVLNVGQYDIILKPIATFNYQAECQVWMADYKDSFKYLDTPMTCYKELKNGI